MGTRGRIGLATAILVAGCGGGQTRAVEAEPATGRSTDAPGAGAQTTAAPDGGGGGDDDGAAGTAGKGLGMPGSSFDAPLETCGAGESYANVASYECPDGSVPLGGDPRAGQSARVGSSGSHVEDPPSPMESHIVDIYEVSCPGGALRVHVCMYHCPEGRSPTD